MFLKNLNLKQNDASKLKQKSVSEIIIFCHRKHLDSFQQRSLHNMKVHCNIVVKLFQEHNFKKFINIFTLEMIFLFYIFFPNMHVLACRIHKFV